MEEKEIREKILYHENEIKKLKVVTTYVKLLKVKGTHNWITFLPFL